jgi:hypothetical protein
MARPPLSGQRPKTLAWLRHDHRRPVRPTKVLCNSSEPMSQVMQPDHRLSQLGKQVQRSVGSLAHTLRAERGDFVERRQTLAYRLGLVETHALASSATSMKPLPAACSHTIRHFLYSRWRTTFSSGGASAPRRHPIRRFRWRAAERSPTLRRKFRSAAPPGGRATRFDRPPFRSCAKSQRIRRRALKDSL